MNFLVELMKVRKVHPLVIFFEAHDFFEIRVHELNIARTFLNCSHQVGDTIYMGDVPDFVQEYCFELLAKTCEPLEVKEYGKHKKGQSGEEPVS